ncbi:MAG TPA: hypothetical protein VGE54_04535 [Brevundimonas sp.]
MTRTKLKKPSHEEFIFQLGRPSVSYGLAVQMTKHDPDAFWENQEVLVVGTCIYPTRFADREAVIRLLGGRDLMDMRARLSGDWKPKAVGFMEAGKTRFEVMMSVPLDAAWEIGAAIAAGTMTVLMTNGPVLFRGKTTLNSFSFKGPEFDPADYIG